MKPVRWTSEEHGGLEHLELEVDEQGVVVESVLIDGEGGFMYRIECDSHWRVTRVAIRRAGGAALELHSNAQGNWTDGSGRPRIDLEGCIDIDISATPFTNTLPIRRLRLDPDERRVIRVVYIALPAMTAEPVEQAYTRLKERRYRYEGITSQYTAELHVDDDGLVIDYPELFRRVQSG
jgi:hypothetical protein